MGNYGKKSCPSCGAECDSSAGRCWFCGYTFSETNTNEKEPVQSATSSETPVHPTSSSGTNGRSNNGIATLLEVLAILVYIGAFIAGIMMGKDYYGDFSFGVALIYWVAGLFSGTMLLGFSEVVQLLYEINRKTK